MSRRTSTPSASAPSASMPLYHTMGVRSLLAMALVDGCLRLPAPLRCRRGVAPDRARAGDQPLSRADALSRSGRPSGFRRGRHRFGRQARLRRRGDARGPVEAGRGGVPAGAVRQSLRLVGDLHLHDRARTRRRSPARPARPGINQRIRVVWLAARDTGRRSPQPARRARSSPTSTSDEAFEGYWRRPDADARALRAGLVLHRRHRLCRRRPATCSSPAGSTT